MQIDAESAINQGIENPPSNA